MGSDRSPGAMAGTRGESRCLTARIERSSLGREELIMREQVDRSARGAGKKIDENVLLVRRVLGKETVRRGLDHRVGVADRDYRAREDSHLDRLGRAVSIEVRGLIRDIEIDVDRFAGERRAG